MSLVRNERCASVIAALSLLLRPCHCFEPLIEAAGKVGILPFADDQLGILVLTLLGIGFLIVLGFLGEFPAVASKMITTLLPGVLPAGCICCHCRMSPDAATISDGLDVYAPRTQSIVWPTLPREATRVREITFRHTPKPLLWNRCRGCSMSSARSKENAARWLLLVATSITCLPLVQGDDNYTVIDWINETQLNEYVEDADENSTEFGLDPLELLIELIDEENTEVEEHHQNSYMSRFIIMALVLHVSVLGIGITIYSCVYWQIRSLRIRRRSRETRRRLQIMSLQSKHVPNIGDCPCGGCILAREMLQGLIMQQLHEMVEC
ncbi:hypothetical protein KR018_000076 [Drosophila ironensis]|nr:hypothetical protein KR018_000076 [Drosophila ironensis]